MFNIIYQFPTEAKNITEMNRYSRSLLNAFPVRPAPVSTPATNALPLLALPINASPVNPA